MQYPVDLRRDALVAPCFWRNPHNFSYAPAFCDSTQRVDALQDAFVYRAVIVLSFAEILNRLGKLLNHIGSKSSLIGERDSFLRLCWHEAESCASFPDADQVKSASFPNRFLDRTRMNGLSTFHCLGLPIDAVLGLLAYSDKVGDGNSATADGRAFDVQLQHGFFRGSALLFDCH